MTIWTISLVYVLAWQGYPSHSVVLSRPWDFATKGDCERFGNAVLTHKLPLQFPGDGDTPFQIGIPQSFACKDIAR